MLSASAFAAAENELATATESGGVVDNVAEVVPRFGGTLTSSARTKRLLSGDGRHLVFETDDPLLVADTNLARDVYLFDRQTGAISLVSVNAGGSGAGFGASFDATISADGTRIAFNSVAPDLVAGDDNGAADVFVRDLATGATSLVSVDRDGTGVGNGESFDAVISEDGGSVAFTSRATNLVDAPVGSAADVFVRRLDAGTTELVSLDETGTGGGNGDSLAAVFDADADTVAYFSFASDLVAGDENGAVDVFVRDLTAGTTTLASVSIDGTGSANGDSFNHTLSRDGSRVAFISEASDLVSGDANAAVDVFVRNVATGTTTLVSANRAGTGSGNGGSFSPGFDPDGQRVVFRSDAADLVANDGNAATDVFVHDLATGATTAVSRVPDGTATGNGESFAPVFAGDGSAVAFVSRASDLGSVTDGASANLWIHRVASGTTELVTIAFDGEGAGNADSLRIAIGDDAGVVAFESLADNLVAGDEDELQDVFVQDLATGTRTLVSERSPSVTQPSTPLTGSSLDGLSNERAAPARRLSDDGRYLVFVTGSPLVPEDRNNALDVYVRDRWNGTVELASVTPAGDAAGAGHSLDPTISGDGRVVAFVGFADDLVATPTSGTSSNVFVRDLDTGATSLVSVTADGSAGGSGHSTNPVLDADGSTLAFESVATDLVANDVNGELADVFLHDRETGTTRLVSRRASDGATGNGASLGPSLSDDGQRLAFVSRATDLAAGDLNGSVTDVFLYDAATEQVSLVSVRSAGDASGNLASGNAVISGDGSFVVFESDATDLVADDVNLTTRDVFLRDLGAGTTELVSRRGDGTGSGNGGSLAPAVSHDGRFVAFTSAATDLTDEPVAGDLFNVFLRDRQENATRLISANADGTATGNASSLAPVLSADGGVILFESEATDLVAGGTAGPGPDVFAHAVADGATVLLSRSHDGATNGDQRSFDPVVSANGRHAAFESFASNLVTNDVNGHVGDLFLVELAAVGIGPQLVAERVVGHRFGIDTRLSASVDLAVLNVTTTEADGASDLSLVGTAGGPVDGSLVVLPDGRNLRFVPTGGPLPPDDYAFSLRSGTGGVRALSTGEPLDGDDDGTPGGDLVHHFTVLPDETRVLRLPDVVRGPGQPIDVAFTAGGTRHESGAGVPLVLSDGDGVTSASFTLEFDPFFVTVADALAGADLPPASTVATTPLAPGATRVTVTASEPLPAGPVELVRLSASIRESAPAGVSAAWEVSGLTLNGGAIAGIGDAGVLAVGLLGDTTADGTYGALDAQRVLRKVVGLDAGFAAWPLLDPALVGDVTGDGVVGALDASRLLAEVVGLDPDGIPPAAGGLQTTSDVALAAGTTSTLAGSSESEPLSPTRETNSVDEWLPTTSATAPRASFSAVPEPARATREQRFLPATEPVSSRDLDAFFGEFADPFTPFERVSGRGNVRTLTRSWQFPGPNTEMGGSPMPSQFF